MWVMFWTRKKKSILTQPEVYFIRTLQAPDHIVFNKSTNLYEFSSQAFNASSGGGSLSGDLEEILIFDGLEGLTLYPSVSRGVGAAAFKVQDALNLGFTIGHEPVVRNWYHGGVRGDFKKSKKQSLKQAAREIVPIDQAQARIYDEQKQAAAMVKVNNSSSVY